MQKQEYPGPDYHILSRNCCHFADDFSRTAPLNVEAASFSMLRSMFRCSFSGGWAWVAFQVWESCSSLLKKSQPCAGWVSLRSLRLATIAQGLCAMTAEGSVNSSPFCSSRTLLHVELVPVQPPKPKFTCSKFRIWSAAA